MKIDTSLPLTGPANPREATRHAEEAGYDGLRAASARNYTPWDADPALVTGIAAEVRTGAPAGGQA
ncbi:hypothetical protein LWC33_15870 [Pseudonocardia sp. RS11V-5]|uniref:hypothetical protein n=1 Tax=Pseudonocardia terrae TaxID=2905831 RepID=UPI001E608E73|nr:hypothetical protein [Pseudonocardia terrae]MCE3552927.1 hypothetical protein [Pseudonocardia terrae]